MREVNSRGRRITGLDPRDVSEGATAGRYVTIARSALARAIYDTLDDEVETIFGDTVDALVDTGDRVQVRLTGGTEREFDLVVGADGLHSRIRSLVFGPEEQFERSLGIAVAAFDVDGYQPRDE